jgi:hypothetical protein
LWSTLFARGELMAARDHVAQALALYDPDRHASLADVYGNHDACRVCPRARRLGARALR